MRGAKVADSSYKQGLIDASIVWAILVVVGLCVAWLAGPGGRH